MDEESKNLVALNLIRFRKIQEKSQEKLSKESGVSLSCIRRIEQGMVESPDSSTLSALAYVLKRPICDFFRPVKLVANVRFRAQKMMKSVQREAVVESCARRLERFCFLEDELGLKEEFALTPSKEEITVDIPELASKTRERLGIAQDLPIVDVADVLQKSKVKFWFDSKTSYKGIFGLTIAQSPQATGVVVFERGKTVERQIFSAIHELGHLILHKNSFDSNIVEENEEEEREANNFASHFLVPKKEFKRRWNETKGEPFVIRVLRVKRYFHVSYQTILYRLVADGLIAGVTDQGNLRQRFAIQYQRRFGKDLRDHYEPIPLDALDAPADRFEYLVFEAVSRGIISFSRAAEFLEVSVSELYDKFSSNGDVENE